MDYLEEAKIAFELVALIGTAVWVVFSLQSTTGKLALSMEHLTRAVEKLDIKMESSVEKLDIKMETSRGDIWGLSGRVTKLETALEVAKVRDSKIAKGEYV